MIHTFHIDGSSQKAKALLDFLRTLEFVKEDRLKNDGFLSNEHLEIVKERRNKRMDGSAITKSWEELKGNLGSNGSRP